MCILSEQFRGLKRFHYVYQNTLTHLVVLLYKSLDLAGLVFLMVRVALVLMDTRGSVNGNKWCLTT